MSLKVSASAIRIAAMQLAGDSDICRMFDMTPAELERYREAVEQGRARGMTGLKFERARAQARRVKKAAND